MSKKKSKQLPITEVQLTPEQIAQAKEILAGLQKDIQYAAAKKNLVRMMPCAKSVANALVMKLSEEGFEGGEEHWFRHPDAPTATGVVQGARRPSDMKVTPQSVDGAEFSLTASAQVVPGDVVELRQTISGWRPAGLVSRPQRRWVCRCVTDAAAKETEWLLFKPISAFAPIELQVNVQEVPPEVDLERDAVELEISADAPFFAKRREDAYWGSDEEWQIFPAHFVRKVGVMNDPLGEMAIASAQFGVPIDFSPDTLAEAEKLPEKVDRRSLLHRVDLTDLAFVTIDGEDARDFDDAVYCEETPEGWRLLVAIADVSHYVRPGTSLDRDAQKRATSVYFPSSVVPMLPEKLSNGLCSLNPGVDRLTLVCDALVNRKGETTAYQFYPAVIHSHGRLTYTAVWSALQGEAWGLNTVGPRLGELKRLYALYGVLRAARSERHALDFETEESAADFAADGEIIGFHVRDHNDAHRIIEECMLVANVCAAQFAIAKKQTTLFRVHGEPEQTKLNDLKSILAGFGISFKLKGSENLAPVLAKLIEDTKDKPYLQTAILRTMQRACYQPENIGHFGLQYPAYAHFTSPIRRYPDLLLHRTIKGILSKRSYTPAVEFDDAELMTGYHARKLGSNPEAKPSGAAKPLSRQEAKKAVWTRLGIICSAAERRADDASREVMKFLKCQYLLSADQKSFQATVTGMCPAGIFVTLSDMPIEGFVHISQLGWGYFVYDPAKQTMTSHEEMTEIRLGDQLTVRLKDVDLKERRINFTLLSNQSRRHPAKGGGRRRFDDDFWY